MKLKTANKIQVRDMIEIPATGEWGRVRKIEPYAAGMLAFHVETANILQRERIILHYEMAICGVFED